MADLITPADLAEYEVEELDFTTARAGRFIKAASAAVIEAAGAPILQARSEIEIPAPPGRILKLPGLPVTAIHSVTIAGAPVEGWKRINAGLYLSRGWSCYDLDLVTVDYTHGLPAVPEDIKDLVARMVIAGLLAAQDGADGLAFSNGQLSSFAIDDYREAYATGEEVEAVTEMTLPERTRERLAKRFGNSGPTVQGQL
ncbi:hypothetical protein [Arthrobacter sp. R-11]|uniref:hypothetical protein n=1 Tax=Arthrobacter sp. R-11 TaxID=3404053 RepID=UPI003CE9067C